MDGLEGATDTESNGLIYYQLPTIEAQYSSQIVNHESTATTATNRTISPLLLLCMLLAHFRLR